jgi:hypothetical protein
MRETVRPFVRRTVVLLLTLPVAACAAPKKTNEVAMGQTFGPAKVTVAHVQAELATLADTHASIIAQAADRVESQLTDPVLRVAVHREKYASILGAYTIAVQVNPLAALLDMTVMVTLSRDSAERFWTKDLAAEQAEVLIAAYRRSEREIRSLAAKAFAAEDLAELDRLTVRWREEHPEQRYVSSIRFSDFGQKRSLGVGGGATASRGNLFKLFYLDPLANLDPTMREIEQSRMLAERVFFLMARMPTLLGFQGRQLLLEAGASPQITQVLEDTNRFVDAAEQLPDRFASQLGEAGSAAINQMQTALTEERQAFLRDLDEGQQNLRGTLVELNRALDSGNELATSLNTLLAKTESNERPQEVEPFEIEQLNATLAETTTAARELNVLVGSLERLISTERAGDLESMLAVAEATGSRLINRVFLLASLLVVIIVVGSIVSITVRRRVAQRAQA